jgi:hypothetical protein
VNAPQRAAILRLCILLAMAWAAVPAPGLADEAARSIYRIAPGKGQDLRPLLRLGLDVAGHGPGVTLDLVLTAEEAAAVRALGFAPIAVDVTPRGLHGAAESPFAQPGLGDYHTVAEAMAEMAAYAAAHPTIARLDTIGTSIEGRKIVGIKISDNVAVDEAEPEVLIVGCHHARELMSVEIPLYVMRRLLDGGSDPVLASLVAGREIWIIPIVNPDGHVYVEEHSGGQSNGWWRKNRRPNGDGTFGVDLNRNYGYLWGYDDIGSSPTTASETYRGTGPFSEPETAAIRDFMAARHFTTSLSFHSYGSLVLYPWGYAPLDTPDHPVFRALGDSMALQNGYRAGNPKNNAIYVTNGAMDDWVYGDTGTKPKLYGYTFEVNTSDQGGFAPNDALIVPTCELNWGPVLTLVRFGDVPRRVLGPPRPANFALTPAVQAARLSWRYPAPDPANPVVRHDLKRIAALTRITDDAEAGVADWDSLRFEWSATRHASGARSYWSGSGDGRVSVLTSREAIDVAAAESLVVRAFWDLESNFDYWYAEASADGGGTWTTLAGDRTTDLDPTGANEGNGITGTSGGVFARAAFSLASFAGFQTLVRFRCATDDAISGEGLYLDDVFPVVHPTGVTVTDTGSPDTTVALVAANGPAHFQVRGIDGEGHRSLWTNRVFYDPTVTAVPVSDVAPALVDAVRGAAPNPFNPRTEVRFTLAAGRAGPYRLDVFDASGRWVARLAEGIDDGQGGPRSVAWGAVGSRGEPLASGVYFLQLETVRGRATGKVTLLR